MKRKLALILAVSCMLMGCSDNKEQSKAENRGMSEGADPVVEQEEVVLSADAITYDEVALEDVVTSDKTGRFYRYTNTSEDRIDITVEQTVLDANNEELSVDVAKAEGVLPGSSIVLFSYSDEVIAPEEFEDRVHFNTYALASTGDRVECQWCIVRYVEGEGVVLKNAGADSSMHCDIAISFRVDGTIVDVQHVYGDYDVKAGESVNIPIDITVPDAEVSVNAYITVPA